MAVDDSIIIHRRQLFLLLSPLINALAISLVLYPNTSGSRRERKTEIVEAFIYLALRSPLIFELLVSRRTSLPFELQNFSTPSGTVSGTFFKTDICKYFLHRRSREGCSLYLQAFIERLFFHQRHQSQFMSKEQAILLTPGHRDIIHVIITCPVQLPGVYRAINHFFTISVGSRSLAHDRTKIPPSAIIFD